MIFYGAKASNLGTQMINAQCDNCNSTTQQKVSTFGRYAHIYWIPFFPIGKKSVGECQTCYKTIPKSQFNQSILSAYSLNKPKTPLTHWSGGIIIALLASFLWYSTATREVDPRRDLLNNLESKMTNTPDQAIDSTSFTIKAFFDDFVTEEMNSNEFKYYTHVDGDKLLTLIAIPELKNLADDQKPMIVEMANKLIEISDGIKDKERYIGVKGNFMYDVGYTPSKGVSNISTTDLYEFFGPKESFQSNEE